MKQVQSYMSQEQIGTLYQKSYYLLQILLQLKFEWSESVPTAGVGMRDGTPHLWINPTFYNSLDEDGRNCVLLHEALHIEYGHILSANYSEYPDKKRLNVAMDLVINSHPEIAYLETKGIGVWPAQFGLPKHETTDFYYHNLPEGVDGGCGEHGEPLPEAVREDIKAAAGQAASAMRRGVWATKSAFNWKQALRNMLASADNFDWKNTYCKQNRREDRMDIPGKKKIRHKKVAVVVDTSGSMLSYLERLVGQVAGIAAADAEVWVIQCDAKVHGEPVLYRRGQGLELVGGGGTEYQPGLNRAEKLGADVIVYLGDMEHFDKLKKVKGMVIWGNVVNSSRPNADFGKFLPLRG